MSTYNGASKTWATGTAFTVDDANDHKTLINNKIDNDGTVAMAADLDMGSNAIVSVGNVDGVDVSALNTTVSGISTILGSVVGFDFAVLSGSTGTDPTITYDGGIATATRTGTGAYSLTWDTASTAANQVLLFAMDTGALGNKWHVRHQFNSTTNTRLLVYDQSYTALDFATGNTICVLRIRV